MALIWTNTRDGWNQGSPKEYTDEAELHRLIEENLRMLPLDGSPMLTFLGSEVYLGYGYADILAVESTGRPVIIEVKLAARSGIVSQILYYAAFLRGKSLASLERQISNLAKGSEHPTIFEAVQAQGHISVDDTESFNSSLQDHLERGDFRLVFALDGVSAELERIVAYLDSFTSEITIDLVTIEIYEVNGTQVAVPTRISPDLDAAGDIANPQAFATRSTPGAKVFRDSLSGLHASSREKFDKLISWAESVADLPNMILSTSTYSSAQVGLILSTVQPGFMMTSVHNVKGEPRIAVWRAGLEHHAPNSIKSIEKAIAPEKIGYGNYIGEITSEVLDALTEAFHEAGNC